MHCHVFTVTIATAGEQYAAYQHDSTVFGAGSPWWTTSGGAKGVYCACTQDRTHFLWVAAIVQKQGQARDHRCPHQGPGCLICCVYVIPLSAQL